MEENKRKVSFTRKYIDNLHHKVVMSRFDIESVEADEQAKKYTQKICTFFNLPEKEAIIFAFLFHYFYDDIKMHGIRITDLTTEVGENIFTLLEYQKYFEALEAKGFINAAATMGEENAKQSFIQKEFYIPNEIGLAVYNDDSISLKDFSVSSSVATDIIKPEKIKEKKLFYPEEIQNDITTLTQYLEEDKFKLIQKRLDEKALPPGMCIMLQGAPGTGKTETVYQIAKKTNRAILHIDLGSVISKWVGETENNISKVFRRYNSLYETSVNIGANVPILLFNEADAVFGKRIANTEHSTEVHENHIQSILLDNIERQKGIFIATTNVIEQFDSAYDRRFLFKIRFNKPNVEVSKLIWKDKFDWLSDEDITTIAKKYTMTGGQIDNILRKTIMQEVLSGRRCTVDEILDYCKKEKFETDEKATIGFGATD